MGYERHDLGVSLPGFYKNIADRSKYTYRSLVPGAKYVLVAQGLTGLQNEIKLTMNVTRTEWKTDEIGELEALLGTKLMYTYLFI